MSRKILFSILGTLIGLLVLWWVHLVITPPMPSNSMDGRKSASEWMQTIETQRRMNNE